MPARFSAGTKAYALEWRRSSSFLAGRIAFPEINRVSESHLGYVAAGDLLQILEDDDGNLMSIVFYENVRDFQGESNPVNIEIAATLSGERRGRFALMNNGVTISSFVIWGVDGRRVVVGLGVAAGGDLGGRAG